MDGENNGKPYEQMDDLGVPLFLETPICWSLNSGALPCWFSVAWRFDGGRKGCILSQKMLVLHVLVYLVQLNNCFFRSQKFRELHVSFQTLCAFHTKQPAKPHETSTLAQMFLHYGPKLRTISLAGNAGFITEERMPISDSVWISSSDHRWLGLVTRASSCF